MMLNNSIRNFLPVRIRQLRPWTTGEIFGLFGSLAIGALVLVVYYPMLKIGFWTDDFGFLENAGRLSWSEYLTLFFDPRVQTAWYRPMQGLQWRFEYLLFRGDPTGYHFVQIFFHLINCVLLYAIVAQATRRRHLGILAALFYVTIPLYSVALMWLAVTDALAAMFCLLTLWLWLGYLERGGGWRYGLTCIAFVATLFGKEVTAPLPMVLFLMDRWLVAKPSDWKAVIRRNAPFFVFLLVYLFLESNAILHGVFPKNMGYTPGLHSFSVFVDFLLQMIVPTSDVSLINYVGLAFLLGVLARAVYKRNFRLLFLLATIFFALLPLMPFHSVMVRYLYMPLMLTGAGFALLCDWVFQRIDRFSWMRRSYPIILSLALVFWILGNGAIIAEGSDNFAGSVRQTNSYFRPLFQRYPALPLDSLVYLIDPPFVTYNVSGLIFLRYGTNVDVASVESKSPAALRAHAMALVGFSDEQGALQTRSVDKDATVRFASNLPVRFQNSISLDGAQVVANRVKRGDIIVLLLYWHTDASMDRNYTVFAHLIDADGKVVAGYDSQPQRGRLPTSVWGASEMVADAIVLPIDPGAPVGENFRLELGLYDPQTMERLAVVDSQGHSISDKLIIEPFSILP